MSLHFDQGPLLIFGGPYSNLEALRALRVIAQNRAIPANNIICTGDVVAYCADAKATVDEIRDWGVHVVMGNCEESLSENALDCGCGFEEGTACDLLSKQWFDHASAELDQAHRDWMASLPRQLNFEISGLTFEVVHGGVDQINRFVFASQSDVINEELSKTEAEIVIGGHCGLPFAHQVGTRAWLNPGVIGMPANEGKAETWFALLHPKSDGFELEFERLSYDHNAAADKMRARNLAGAYAQSLNDGLWPSLDVLPDIEKDQTGQPLDLETFIYQKADRLFA